MEWKKQLENLFDDHSRDFPVHYLSRNPGDIKKLIAIIEEKDEKPAWRAAWVIDHIKADELVNNPKTF